MNIKPTEELLEACRRVLGADDPRTVQPWESIQ